MHTNQGLAHTELSSKSHYPLRLFIALVLALSLSLFGLASAWAAGTVLSGMFDGSEPVIAPLAIDPQTAELVCSKNSSRYLQSNFAVTAGGTYRFSDALGDLSHFYPGDANAVNVTAHVYEGGFDASHPGQNLIASGGFRFAYREVNLIADTNYVLVVQLSCTFAEEGAWAVTFTGPGRVNSEHAVSVPAFTMGAFTENDPSINSGVFWDGWYGGYGRYQQSGPIRVSSDGAYYFTAFNGDPLCLLVYTAPINPDDLWANLVTAEGLLGVIQLRAGQDYYFVIQQCYGDDDEYVYVLAPSAPFRINHGLADSWYNPETPGQGFFLDVLEQRNEVFLGWFTYATDPLPDDAFGHRWLTAFGPFAGNSADLAIEWTSRGAFNAAQPVPEQHVDGAIQLEFNDCTSGQIIYSSDGDGTSPPVVSRVIPIQRNVNDAVALCESLYAGPGMPGSL